jgi:hypothetical protein
MMQFQFKFLDKRDLVVLTRLKTIVDDQDALAEAERLSATHTIEVWHGSRHVGRVKKAKSLGGQCDRHIPEISKKQPLAQRSYSHVNAARFESAA